MARALAAVLAVGLPAASAPALAQGLTSLTMTSDPGDQVGGGHSYALNSVDATFSAAFGSGGVAVSVAGNSLRWDLRFAPPAGQSLTPGAYERAADVPVQGQGMPAFSVSGEGRRCQAVGRFVVLEAEAAPTGEVKSLAIDFEQHCYGGAPALFGSLRVNSTVSLERRISGGRFAAHEGDGERRTLAFQLSLSSRADFPVSVGYATVDDTAKAGVDYVAASGTAVVPAGEASVQIEVSVLGNTVAQPDRRFFLALSDAVGAAIAFPQVTGTILDDDTGQTFFHLDSDPGDWIGQGAILTRTSLDGAISATLSGNRVDFKFTKDFEWWSFTFVAPANQVFSPGVYEAALRSPFQSPAGPGLDVSGQSRGCNHLFGRFVVLEAEVEQDGAVRRLAVDFEQHCEGGPAALFGSVRYASTVGLEPRVSVASAAAYEGDGDPERLEFWVSLSARAAVSVSVQCRTVDGTAKAGTDYEPEFGILVIPAGKTAARVDVPVYGDISIQPDRTMTLALANPVGAPLAFGQGAGRILDDDGARTLVRFDGDQGDYIAGGLHYTMTPLDGTISAIPVKTGLKVKVDVWTWWYLFFAAPGGRLPTPGVYEGATSWSSEGALPYPTFDISGDGRGCSPSGRFVVLEGEYGPDGEVHKLAIDFEQHCDGGAPALFGSVRINSDIRLGARLSVAPAATYEGDGEPKSLSFWLSLSAKASVPVNVDYTTMDGTAKAGIDYTAVSGTVTFAPGKTAARVDVPVVGDRSPGPDRTFALSLSRPAGAPIAFGEGVGTIADDDAIRTQIWLDSEPGDYVGFGKRLTLRPLDGMFSATRATGGVQVGFIGSKHWWSLTFVAPGGALLTAGMYERAIRYPFQGPRPGLSVSGEGRGCSNLNGRFLVLEAEYKPDGGVERFAADFEQHCEGQPPALYGSVRYNSAIPVPARSPFAPRVRGHL